MNATSTKHPWSCIRFDSLESEFDEPGVLQPYNLADVFDEKCKCERPPSFADVRLQRAALNSAQGNASSAVTVRLDAVLSPGDVLCVKGGNDRITQLGARGGFMGHVLMIVAPLQGIHRDTPKAVQFQGVWPQGADVRTLWVARTMESTRDEEGFHETDLILYTDDQGHVFACGESGETLFRYQDPSNVEVWQAPVELRQTFRLDLMHAALAEMKKHEASWSWSTAIRAFLLPAELPRAADPQVTMKEIAAAWKSEPICTSVVLVFWQRYLALLARTMHGDVSAVDLILKWLPLRSDRVLPGELLSTMQKCGWNYRTQVQ